METFQEFHNQKMLEEQLVLEGIGDIIDSVKETGAAVMDLPGEIGTYIKGVGEWTMDLGLTTAGGAIAAQGLGALLEIIAKKLDDKRKAAASLKKDQRDYMIDTEFQKAINTGEKLSEEQQMKLLTDISEKWAEKYKIPQPRFFVTAMRKVGKALRSKLGTYFSAVLAFFAFKMLIPFPTF